MAVEHDSAANLQTISDALQEQYFDKFIETGFVTGGVTNRLLSMAHYKATGDGVTLQYKRAIGNTFKIGNDPLADFGVGTVMQAEKWKARWNVTDSSVHDFANFKGATRLNHYDVVGAGDAGAIASLVKNAAADLRGDFDWKMAVSQNVPRSGLVARVNGPVKDNASNVYASCGAFASLSAGARTLIDGGSVALFRKGVEYDVYTSGGVLVATRLMCNGEINATDTTSNSSGSVGWISTSRTTAGAGTLADNCEFYLDGSKNKNMWGREAWLTQPAASGDVFIGGVNRSSPDFQFLVPVIVNGGSTVANRGHLDSVATAMSFMTDNPDIARSVVANGRIIQTFRNQINEAAFINIPSTDDRAKRFGNLGSMGLNYQHPDLGLVKFLSDPMMSPDKIDFLAMNTWMFVDYGNRGLQIMPGDIGKWSRVPSSTPGNGLGMIYSLDAYSDGLVVCENAQANARVTSITP